MKKQQDVTHNDHHSERDSQSQVRSVCEWPALRNLALSAHWDVATVQCYRKLPVAPCRSPDLQHAAVTHGTERLKEWTKAL